jgi:hypothetical protein
MDRTSGNEYTVPAGPLRGFDLTTDILFAGATFILVGLAVALGDGYPRWLGWIAVAAGVASIIGPTLITLWLAVIGVLLGRKAWRRPDRQS